MKGQATESDPQPAVTAENHPGTIARVNPVTANSDIGF